MTIRESRSILAKLGVVAVIVALLMIPMYLIRSLIEERESRWNEVTEEVGALWGTRQRIAGPVISMPLRATADGGGGGEASTTWVHMLPDELHVEAEIDARERRRGIFETVVYAARLRIRAKFRFQDRSRVPGLDRTGGEITLGLADLRGLGESPILRWQGQELDVSPAREGPGLTEVGLQAPVAIDASGGVAELEATMLVNGSGALELLPLGKDTTVSMTSNWGNPSFRGAFLPSDPEVADDSFRASWSIPKFARNFPQLWLDRGESGTSTSRNILAQIDDSAFGVDLLMAVDYYQKVERCTKYALLFIVLTFASFLLFELLADLRVHPVQYLMVGVAVCLFYQLLLAISEHVAFAPSYFVAASATVLLISGYSSAVLKTRRRGAVLLAALAVLYGVLFVLVQLQTYTLLVGSVTLFLGLAAFMYLTRDLDWYELSGASSVNREAV